jgi:hypothetical protein
MIVSGNSSFIFAYVPSLLTLPPGVALVNAHGLVQNPTDGSILLTYEPDHTCDNHCLVRWRPDGTGGVGFGAGTELCAGTPHGLRLAVEDGEPFLYHANNGMALHKTRLDGSLVWSVSGPPDGNASYLPFRPTWFATPPGSQYIYLADGYGSNFIHVYDRSGRYSGRSFGGRGTAPGLFQTCHAINFDPRRAQLVVSDRENHRHQYFDFKLSAVTSSDVSFTPASQFHTAGLERPCHIRFFRDGGAPADNPAAGTAGRAAADGGFAHLSPDVPFVPLVQGGGQGSIGRRRQAEAGPGGGAAAGDTGTPAPGELPWGAVGRDWAAEARAGVVAAGGSPFGSAARPPAVASPQRARGLASAAGKVALEGEAGPASHAVVASLDGSVGILDPSNRLVATVEVARLLGDRGHLHPHDAIVLANGDLVVATWSPGRLSYWRRVGVGRAGEQGAVS